MSGLALMALLAASSAASDQAGSAARIAMARVMKCSLRSTEPAARSQLARGDDTPGGNNWASLLVDSCVRNQRLVTKPAVVRGVMFDVLYNKDYASSPAITSFADVKPVMYPAKTVETDVSRAAALRLAFSWVDCGVRRAPAAARALIVSSVGTREEEVAMQQVETSVRTCAPEGVPVLGNVFTRGFAAEALYRLTAAKRPMPVPLVER